MPKPPTEDLATFLRRQPAETLADLLLELASDHDPVRDRLARLQLAARPDKLAAAFRKSLAGWKRSRRHYDYRETRNFAAILQAWLDQVARELLPRDPPAAVELFEAFIRADATCWNARMTPMATITSPCLRWATPCAVPVVPAAKRSSSVRC